jgi:hypothetical protein
MRSTPSNARHRIALSRQELYMISQSINREFSPRQFAGRASRKPSNSRFTPRELLDISQQISRDYAPGLAGHQPGLVLLMVSPRRLHAYWHLAKKRLNSLSPAKGAEQPMTLRIYAESASNPQQTEIQQDGIPQWFDMAISPADGHQDIWLPEASSSLANTRYRAELGEVRSGDNFVAEVSSNTALVAPPGASDEHGELTNPVLQAIMTVTLPAASGGKTASGQGK